MRIALLVLVMLAGCATAGPPMGACLDDTALALYVSVETAVAADDWLARLERLSHANQGATDAAVARALRIDQAMAAGGDESAARRVQHERAWLASRQRG